MSVIDILSCKEFIQQQPQAIPFELQMLVQGLDTNDNEKVKKFLNGLDDFRLKQLVGLNKEHVRMFLIQLMRLMSEGGCI